MKNRVARKPEILLPLSIKFAKEYFDQLCIMQKNAARVQESNKHTIIHRALWTALIIEVGRLFDTHSNVISFKKLPELKKEIDKYHSEAIIGKIIETRKTFTAHFADRAKEVVSAPEICKSKLGKILDNLNKLSLEIDSRP